MTDESGIKDQQKRIVSALTQEGEVKADLSLLKGLEIWWRF